MAKEIATAITRESMAPTTAETVVNWKFEGSVVKTATPQTSIV
jgi:hypothetical protein